MKFYIVILTTYLFIGFMKVEATSPQCRYSSWSSWSECTQTCGSGKRTRKKTPIGVFRLSCMEETNSEICNPKCCPVDCEYYYTNGSECIGCKGEDGIKYQNLVISKEPICGGEVCPTQEKIIKSCKPSR